MAVHQGDAAITPSKDELLSVWLAAQAWAPSGDLSRLGSYRLDDPAGEVGIECFALSVGSAVVHLPVTYRGTPLEGATLIGEMEHTLLGHRWVYDGCSDPVAVRALIAAIVGGGREAEIEVHVAGERVGMHDAGVRVHGSGHGSVDEVDVVDGVDGVSVTSLGAVASVSAGGYELDVLRLIGSASVSGDGVLTASWPGFEGVVAAVRSAG